MTTGEINDDLDPDCMDEEDRVGDAIVALHQLKTSVDARTERYETMLGEIGKLLRRVIYIVAVGVATFILALILSISNRSILNTINEVTDPTGKYAKRSATNTARILSTLSQETDCRARRAVKGLPAPADPLASCLSQTPLEVYPG